jgi:tyrosine-protein phosphatase non-receptor type 23
MSSLNLDPSRLNLEPERLPQDLLEKCAAVSVRQNAIKDLVEAMGGMVVLLISYWLG